MTFTEETHLPWGIGAKGDEYIVLLNADGTEHSRVNIPALSDVTAPAYARTEDGDSEWAVVANPTKNASNAGGSGNGGDEPEPDPIADYTKLFINEVKTSGDASGDNQDFIELFNAGNAALDLTGFKLHDSGNKNHLIISGSIEAGGFMTFTETTHFSWGLSAKGDEYVVLLNPNGTQHSRIDLPAMADITNPAYARTEDGGSTWATVATPTKNASNNQ